MTGNITHYISSARHQWVAGHVAIRFGQVLFALWVGVTLAAALLFGWAVGPIALTCCVFAVVACLSLRGVKSDYPHGRLGLCNVVTALRAAMIALLSGAILWPDGLENSRAILVALAVAAFAMDGLDGWLARTDGTSSEFGARFDMEVDALFGAVLALLLLSNGVVGLEVLLLGFMRYGFVVAGFIWPWLNGSLPESYRRKAVCVLQIAVLILLMLPLGSEIFMRGLAVMGAAMLAWSFAVDTIWLARRRS